MRTYQGPTASKSIPRASGANFWRYSSKIVRARLALSHGFSYVMLLCSNQELFRASFCYHLAIEPMQVWLPHATGNQRWRE